MVQTLNIGFLLWRYYTGKSERREASVDGVVRMGESGEKGDNTGKQEIRYTEVWIFLRALGSHRRVLNRKPA